MRKYSRIMAVVLMLAVLTGLAGCAEKTARADFLPTSSNDEFLVVLPEDWQFLENWQETESVPRLTLAFNAGAEYLEPMQFNHGWGYYTDETKEEITAFVACGVHPLDAQPDLPQLTDTDGAVRLVWQAEPSEFSLTAYAYDVWQQQTCGSTLPEEILHTEIAVAEDGSFSLLADEHSYVYVIDAKWQTDEVAGLGGDCVWAFYVE